MNYTITVSKAVNGVIIEVGCKRFVFNDIDAGFIKLREYIVDQDASIASWKEEYPKDLHGVNEDTCEETRTINDVLRSPDMVAGDEPPRPTNIPDMLYAERERLHERY